METKLRRREILRQLQRGGRPITGGELAERMKVSRQAIVQDIAVLRAAGEEIIATSEGYIYLENGKKQGIIRAYLVRHDPERLEEELFLIVKAGGKVLDVSVEHPLYGELSGPLQLSSEEDVSAFISRIKKDSGKLLSNLTGGIHVHKVEAADEATQDKILDLLREKGFLFEQVSEKD